MKAAYSTARALVIRQAAASAKTSDALIFIESATRAIEQQLANLEQIATWGSTVKHNGEKIFDRANKMRGDLENEVRRLDEQLAALKSAEPPA